MIRLTKLRDNDAAFGDLIRQLHQRRLAYRAAREAAEDVAKFEVAYRTVKPAVAHETAQKCAYCESFVTDTYPGDVEHILPKANDPERTLDYDNLTFVCWKCNNHKRREEPRDGLGLLNPYVDAPETFIRFFGTTVMPVPRDPDRIRALRTIAAADLNRPGLIERRKKVVDALTKIENTYNAAAHPAVKEQIEEEIREAQQPANEHSLLARAYFRQAGITV